MTALPGRQSLERYLRGQPSQAEPNLITSLRFPEFTSPAQAGPDLLSSLPRAGTARPAVARKPLIDHPLSLARSRRPEGPLDLSGLVVGGQTAYPWVGWFDMTLWPGILAAA